MKSFPGLPQLSNGPLISPSIRIAAQNYGLRLASIPPEMAGCDWPRRRDRHNCDIYAASQEHRVSSRAGLALLTDFEPVRCKVKNWENMDPHNFVTMGMHTLLYSNQIILK